MSVGPKDEKGIFEAAMALKTPSERETYLDEACGADTALRARVAALLMAGEDRGHFLNQFVSSSEYTSHGLLVETCGTVIGRYKLLEKIGEGGMAVVYMAEQTEPIRRKVALKIIKLGMDTQQVIARFEAERQALAMMDHPNIAKVLDAGATETGRPYFVMELVQGVSITEYCDQNNLSTKDRLNLFLEVCHAVQHAHQKGIIHRDIKPSNVMVTHHDGKPVPKVIDFGIAKATNQKLTEKTLFTRYAHIIGTPAYMSPEQAELSDLDVDTRTDIYSLGVLLYELLTGTTPFSEEELRKAGYIEMQRVIREQEPVKPSTKLSTLGETLTDIAKRRNCTPDFLRKAVRGDLDWIVMKSLEKDRTRRYETASSLAEEIRRHLASEPVLARGPGTAYRLHKFVRRNRTRVLGALAFGILIAFTAVVLSIWNRDRRQLEEAVLSQAHQQYAEGDLGAALEMVESIFDSRRFGPRARLLYATVLVERRQPDEAKALLNGLLRQEPAIAGTAHVLMVRLLREAGSLETEALEQIREYQRRAEALLPKTAEAYFMQAMGAMTIKEQLALLNEALKLNPDYYEALRLRAFTHYASRQYDRMLEDAFDMTNLRRRDPLGHSLRAVALRELGSYGQANAAYDRALKLVDKNDARYVDLSIQRCETLMRMGRYEYVATAAQEMLQLWPDKPIFQYHLFCARTALGDVNEAQEVFQKIVRSAPTARNEFWFWATKYVFDTLEAGRSWHGGGPAPKGAAFLPLLEAEETYRGLSVKARRIFVGGFGGQWSPDGRKLAFSLGVQGYSGVALYDAATKETELLIVPGKDPRWSPDGRYLAFVRDRQALRLEELTSTERKNQSRWLANEEVWVMKSDGTEPRRLARGGWPSWSRDSARVYYHSRQEKMLCSIAIAGSEVEPKRIMACPSAFPSVSPDEQQVAYVEYRSLKVEHLVSHAVVAQWHAPFDPWGGPVWSPTGHEVCLDADCSVGDGTGLWIYPLDSNEPTKVLTGQIMAASWAPDGTKLVFALRPPYFELWTVDLDPGVSTVKALGPGQTLAGHWQDMLRLYTRRIETDPQDAYAYAERARCYDYLHERTKAEADMQRWSAIMSGRSPSDLWFATRHGFRHVLDLPFDCELVFSAERPVNKIPVFSIAFGQKERCERKLFEIPMVATSLVGLGFLAGLDAPARADVTFGTPVNIQSTFPSLDPTPDEFIDCFSPDGLEVYFESVHKGGQGGIDLWVFTRASVEDDWGPPENLGPIVNTASNDRGASITGDGLELYFASNRPGGYGPVDIYVTRRATRTSPWGPPTNNLGPKVNGSFSNIWPMVSPDGLGLYVSSNRPGGLGESDLYVSKRATTQDPWGDPVNLGPAVNGPFPELINRLSPNGLLLFFESPRPGGFGQYGDGYVARRASRSAPWQPAVNLGPRVNATPFNWPVGSPDGSALYIVCDPNDDGSNWTYKVPILPIVDFNAGK
ncbi:MAG: protein kinase [Sedimentisphaerales bacterium]|nr:protein kinase [Sedimentisphaerales bacterium]